MRNDYKVFPNSQAQRAESQPDLWDVKVAGYQVLTAQGQDKAQVAADRLNIDPYAYDHINLK